MSPAARVGHVEPAGLWAASVLWGPGRDGSLRLCLLSRVRSHHGSCPAIPCWAWAGWGGVPAFTQGRTLSPPPLKGIHTLSGRGKEEREWVRKWAAKQNVASPQMPLLGSTILLWPQKNGVFVLVWRPSFLF